MAAVHLTDKQWAFIQPLLPTPARTGRPRVDDRRTVEGILYVLITGCRWQDLPRAYAPTTVWRRLKHWGDTLSRHTGVESLSVPVVSSAYSVQELRACYELALES